MNHIHTVIFDFDGTLADTQKASKEAFLTTLNDIGAAIPIDPFFDHISSLTLEGMFKAVGIVDEALLQKAVLLYCNMYKCIGPRKAKLFTGIREVLDTLEELSYSIAIATNEKRDNLKSLSTLLNIKDYFAVTVCEDEVCRPKPNPDMISIILAEIGSHPSNTIIVGDSVHDISAGKAAGCYTCGVLYGSHSENKLRKYSPDWIIDNPLDLFSVLNLPSYLQAS